jgi:hypothetical protein
MFSWVKPGDAMEWQVKKMSHDPLVPQASAIVTVVQGVANTSHRLILKGEALNHLKEIRIYQPPLKD